MTSVPHRPCMVTLAGWLLVSLVALLLVDHFTLERYFFISFIGLLSVMQLYAPTENGDRWWLPLRALVGVFFVVFAYVVYVRVMTIV